MMKSLSRSALWGPRLVILENPARNGWTLMAIGIAHDGRTGCRRFFGAEAGGTDSIPRCYGCEKEGMDQFGSGREASTTGRARFYSIKDGEQAAPCVSKRRKRTWHRTWWPR